MIQMKPQIKYKKKISNQKWNWLYFGIKVHFKISNLLKQASDILIFSLNNAKGANLKEKKILQTYVQFPINGLNLTNFILNKNKPQDDKLETSRVNGLQNNKPLIYDLYAVQSLYDFRVGKYQITTIAKNQLNGQWYNFDGFWRVCEIDQSELLLRRAYLLFYRRRT